MKNCFSNDFWNQDKAELVKNAISALDKTYEDEKGINHLSGSNLPSKNEIYQIIDDIEEIIFPGYAHEKILDLKNINYFVGNMISKLYVELFSQVSRAFRYQCSNKELCKSCDIEQLTEEAVSHFIKSLAELRNKMKLDVEAAYEGDPAAKSLEEIIISYPGLYAIMVYRIAHELHIKDVPLIPRIMTEYAHSKVGIDIHPGAKIGLSFFIDHGTGVVIGETSILGNHCKIFQGVTLGALSFPKTPDGKIIRDRKRHPTLEDNVTIYSGATVLGDIVIGKSSVIGGNVWLTECIPPNTLVTISKNELSIKTKK
ncbi:MAG TPA: serine acetyltransferase [Lentisphaeria bacterium]|nr:MAG: hypothetical protein A2X47_13310 [Lentisphaerae bacterium GWF2_38_69]HBM15970.1 serine acetyltransferase [Lentisphaeria bacterium]